MLCSASYHARVIAALALSVGMHGCRDAPAVVPPTSPPQVAPASSALPRASSATRASSAPPPSEAVTLSGPCKAASLPLVFTSPHAPKAGAPVRILAVSDTPIDAQLALRDEAGRAIVVAGERHGNAPYWWFAEAPAPAEGAYRATVEHDGRAIGCRELVVERDPKPAPPSAGAFSKPTATWGRATEALYSAWLEKLFDAPLEEQLQWPALHDVLRDDKRNMLHDYLGEGEDDPGPHAVALAPDCADLPYFLRAYFAHKLGLPFGYSSCTRGGGGQPPTCLRFHSSLEHIAPRADRPGGFGEFLRVTLADTVHSGTGRVGPEEGDYYPVPLTFESLRPGTIFADPYGHVLIVVKRLPQTESSGGILLAVDGQPDGTVYRRRFWRGNFLFAHDPSLGSPGFKRFRPVVVERGAAHALTNAEIQKSADYGDVSLQQSTISVDGFYDAMDDALSPSPLDPERALRETIDALEEQVRGRILSVQNGAKHWATGGGKIEMPTGPTIFETTGPWEDLSTPSRDLRLLIAIDVVRGFPERVGRRKERYAMPAGKSADAVRASLDALLDRELQARTFSYERSDGSPFRLSLADIVSRRAALEMAYNPSDCNETRWAAPPGSAEASTCKRRAPAAQRAKMAKYRSWFHERKRPPRE